eukprot:1622375-Amphidinium_carterae.1
MPMGPGISRLIGNLQQRTNVSTKCASCLQTCCTESKPWLHESAVRLDMPEHYHFPERQISRATSRTASTQN